MKKISRFASALLFFTALLAAHGRCAAAATADSYMTYIKGLMDEYAGNTEEAYDSYLKVAAMDSGAASVRRQAVRLGVQLGRVDKAHELAAQLVKDEPDSSENWTLLGALLWAKNDRGGARNAYEKAIALDPGNANALYQAAALLKPADPQLSEKYFKKYMEALPDAAPQALYEMAILNFKNGNRLEAEKLLGKSLEQDPGYVRSLLALAQMYEVKGDTAAALGTYQKLEQYDSKDPALLAHIGELYMTLDNSGEARAYFDKAVSADKTNATASFWLAVLCEKNGEFARAAAVLRDSADYAKDPSLWLRVSYYLTRSGKYSDAVKELQIASVKWPDNAELGYFLALGLDDIGETKNAFEVLKKITVRKPDYREARLQYAMLAEKLGDMPAAEANFKALLEKTPDDAMILNYLGYSLADRGLKLGEAEGYIKKALSLSPQNGAYADSLGWVYFKQGKTAQALEQLKAAVALINADEAVWLHLGEAFLAAGDAKSAWLSFKLSQFIKPGQKGVDSRIDAAEARLPPPGAGALYPQFLAMTAPHLTKYNALCKLAAEGGSRAAEFGAILSYSTAALSLDITGPMFTPVMGFKLSADENGKKQFQARGDAAGAAELSQIAQDMLALLYDYYSGAVYSGSPVKISGSCLQSGDTEICLDKSMTVPRTLVRKNGAKVSLKLDAGGGPESGGLPGNLEFRSGRLTVRISVTRAQTQSEPGKYSVPGLR
ncbi:MAG: tetratricopeptide repeat protein [Elusimicrobiales bacterium]|nr:tetratricopeptide repeat protein [Elusimicrobiales bacterium]